MAINPAEQTQTQTSEEELLAQPEDVAPEEEVSQEAPQATSGRAFNEATSEVDKSGAKDYTQVSQGIQTSTPTFEIDFSGIFEGLASLLTPKEADEPEFQTQPANPEVFAPNEVSNPTTGYRSVLYNPSSGDMQKFPGKQEDDVVMSGATPAKNDAQVKSPKRADPVAFKTGVDSAANALGIDPVVLATAIGFETGNTFDPMQPGPTTKWGQHRGFIQFGEPQAQEYGVDWARPTESQLGADGAVVKYLKKAGVKPGMGLLDVYSAINAGGVGLYGRRDNGTTVAEKVGSPSMKNAEKHARKMLEMGSAGKKQETLVAAPGSDRKEDKGSLGLVSNEAVLRTANKRGYTPDIENLQPAFKTKLEELQTAFGSEFDIVSGYRDPNRNRRAGGASKSRHIQGDAVDIDVSSWSKEKRISFIRKARELGFGGVGVYANSIHLDTGAKRNWGPTHSGDSTPRWALEALS